MGLIATIIIGGIAGFIAGKLWRGEGFGIFLNIILGIIGAAVAGWLFDFLSIGFLAGHPWLRYLLTGIVGSLLLLVIYNKLIARK
ncbi:MAG: GlsB/YeaQ/YmgE family stress response membrane protein [Leptospiraceae bacterium]|nr:GlsB/YeaQ/YmgE family stress response membrane protein [Leptospiraceae bacterium]